MIGYMYLYMKFLLEDGKVATASYDSDFSNSPNTKWFNDMLESYKVSAETIYQQKIIKTEYITREEYEHLSNGKSIAWSAEFKHGKMIEKQSKDLF